MISRVAASEREEAQTIAIWGCRTAISDLQDQPNPLESGHEEGEMPVGEDQEEASGILSTAGHGKSCWKQAGPSAKAK